MLGPSGVRGVSGGAPRADILNRQSTPLLSANHSHGSPQVALSEASVNGRGAPVDTSTTQSSTPVSRMTA